MTNDNDTVGPKGKILARNIIIRREEHDMTLARLSRRTAKYGKPILPRRLQNIEALVVEVTVDELFVLAQALMCTPEQLLTDRSALTHNAARNMAGAYMLSVRDARDLLNGILM